MSHQSHTGYTALFLQGPDGTFSVLVPDLPGCFSQGENYEQAVYNIQEAISLYREDFDDSKKELYCAKSLSENFAIP